MNIVFDFGAVLFNWQPGALLQQFFPERVTSAPAAQAMAKVLFGHADWHDFDRGVLDMETVIERTATRMALPRQATQRMVQGIGEHLQPMAETVALLRQLQDWRDTGGGDCRLYYLSNMPVPYARFLQAQHAFLRCFDGGLFSGDVQLAKPDPAIYLALQQRYALQPQDTLFIDDVLANVQAAQALGWQGLHFESPQRLSAQLGKDSRCTAARLDAVGG